MSGCLVVMQPTFLPWPGYFNLISQADDFVFLDDVQLEKQSWQTRNRLLINGQAHWVSAPVRHECLAQTIAATQVLDNTRWRPKLARSIAQNYGKHPHYADVQEVVALLIDHPSDRLMALNEALIHHIAARLNIHPKWHRASEMNIVGSRSSRLILFCEHFGSDEYLSPAGSAEYLAEDGFSYNSAATLRFQRFPSKPYEQKGSKEFVSHLSIIDALANLGWDRTKRYVQEGNL